MARGLCSAAHSFLKAQRGGFPEGCLWGADADVLVLSAPDCRGQQKRSWANLTHDLGVSGPT